MRNVCKSQYITRVKRIVIQTGTVFLLLMGTAACASAPNDTTIGAVESSNPVQVNLSQDTKGEYIQIQSDNVAMAGYDASTQRMTVLFDNGKAYWYQPVERSVWTAFYNAQPHPWCQVGYSQLVEAGIPYGRAN